MKVKTLHRYRREVAHLSNIRSTVAASTQGDDYIFFFQFFLYLQHQRPGKIAEMLGKSLFGQTKNFHEIFFPVHSASKCVNWTPAATVRRRIFWVFVSYCAPGRPFCDIHQLVLSKLNKFQCFNYCATEPLDFLTDILESPKWDFCVQIKSDDAAAVTVSEIWTFFFFSSNHFFPLFESENKIRRKKNGGPGENCVTHTAS